MLASRGATEEGWGCAASACQSGACPQQAEGAALYLPKNGKRFAVPKPGDQQARRMDYQASGLDARPYGASWFSLLLKGLAGGGRC